MVVLRRLASSSFLVALLHIYVDLLRIGDDFNLLRLVHWLFRQPYKSASGIGCDLQITLVVIDTSSSLLSSSFVSLSSSCNLVIGESRLGAFGSQICLFPV